MTHLVISVHGIRTFGNWQERLERLLYSRKASDHDLNVINYKFNYFSAAAFLLPPFRWLVVRRFQSFLLDLVRDRTWERIDLVGHSFGTYVIAWALARSPEHLRPHVDTIVLSGSVLKLNFKWGPMIGRSIRRLVNDCGTRDGILWFSQLGVFTGMAGRFGFNGGTGKNFRNRFFEFGHSDYFLKDGKPSDSFMDQFWVPLLLANTDIDNIDTRDTGPLSGLKVWALNNSDPVKLVAYVTLPCLIFYYGYDYLNTRHVRSLNAESSKTLK